MSVRSAGILAYRFRGDVLQVMLAHPGGPFWTGRDKGAWSIPKGLYDEHEAPLDAALREFREETGFMLDGAELIDLGELRQPSGKIIHAWAAEGDFDVSHLVSNTFPLEWPKGSGRVQRFPEIDRAAWFDVPKAEGKILKGQKEFLDRLVQAIGDRSGRTG